MVKLTDVIKRFNGEGDVSAWIERFEMVWRLQGSEDDPATILPLFLEGVAYEVYAQMAADDKKDSDKLKAGLQSAFGMSPALAYAKFRMRELAGAEAPDAFLAELRRLARAIAGGDGQALEPIVLCQFVEGLPEPARSQLRALKSGANWNVSEVLASAKGLLQQHCIGPAGLLGRKAPNGDARRSTGKRRRQGEHSAEAGGSGRGMTMLKCKGCLRWGHSQEQCHVRCFRCNGVGHIRSECVQAGQSAMSASGNGGGGAASERVAPQKEC